MVVAKITQCALRNPPRSFVTGNTRVTISVSTVGCGGGAGCRGRKCGAAATGQSTMTHLVAQPELASREQLAVVQCRRRGYRALAAHQQFRTQRRTLNAA